MHIIHIIYIIHIIHIIHIILLIYYITQSAPAIGICRPPNILLRSLAPLAAKIIPTFTIEGDIRLPEISRLPQVLESIEKDQMIHRKVSFGTGNIILKLCNELERRKDPKICIPTLFIHGTADKITE